MKRLLLLALGVLICAGAVALCLRSPRSSQAKHKPPRIEDARPLTSLVLLLRSPRKLDRPSLAAMVEEAWGVTLADGPDAQQHVLGDGPSFTIQTGGHQFQVHSYDRPYGDDPQRCAAKFADPRQRQAMLDQRAWLAVDFVEGAYRMEEKAAYQLIGKLVAQLAADDCLAVFWPRADRMRLYDGGTRAVLRSENPLTVFEQPLAIEAADLAADDPRLSAQTAEAKRRWPEFLAAFAKRDGEQVFSVKAAFGDGDAMEAMWVDVEAIHENVIFGVLADAPLVIRSPREGEKVKVKAADVCDWEYTQGDKAVGGFTKD